MISALTYRRLGYWRGRLMRQHLWLVLLVLSMPLAGCGGGDDEPPPVPAKILFGPATMSLNVGAVQQTNGDTVAAPTVVDASNAPITSATITFDSTNKSVATVSPAGTVCAGEWRDNFVNCVPLNPPQLGTAEIVATSATLTARITVFVHERVDSIQITTPIDCKSQNEKETLTARAFTNKRDAQGNITPTEIPSHQLGTFAWSSLDVNVASVASTAPTTAEVTAKQPGRTQIFASISGANSKPVVFTTCPVQNIFLHVKDSAETTFQFAKAETKALAADVFDSKGAAVTGVPLTFFSSEPAVATVPAGTATAQNFGTTNFSVACTPPACNIGLNPVYSTNVVTATVPGTSETTVYAASTESKTLIPIETTTNTPGTAITLPDLPNSFMFSPLGARGFLGSANGLMVLDATANTVTKVAEVKGKVIAASQTGKAVITDTAADPDKVYIYNSVNATFETLTLTGVTAAAFSPDEFKTYLVGGTNLYIHRSGVPLREIDLDAAANDVTFQTSGTYGFLAGGSSLGVLARATCDNTADDSQSKDISTAGDPPELIESVPANDRIVAANSPNLEVITISTIAGACPPGLTAVSAPKDFGLGSFVARQLWVTTDSARAIITSDKSSLLVWDLSQNMNASVNLDSSAAPLFTGGPTLDGKTFYVGASDGRVHRIDLIAKTDGTPIDPGLKKEDGTTPALPNLVAVRPK